MQRVTGKFCWLAKQYRKGWRVGFCIGNRQPIWLPTWFASAPDVAKAMRGKCVYLHRRAVDGPKELDI